MARNSKIIFNSETLVLIDEIQLILKKIEENLDNYEKKIEISLNDHENSILKKIEKKFKIIKNNINYIEELKFDNFEVFLENIDIFSKKFEVEFNRIQIKNQKNLIFIKEIEDFSKFKV